MRLYDLKEYVYDLVARYFSKATIYWSNEVGTKPELPVVLLTLRNPTRQSFPSEKMEDDGPVRYYSSTVTLEVDIFSKGGKMPGGGYSDDTLADMNEFLLYLDSPEITDELFANDLAVDILNPVQSVPSMLGEAKTEYRAMVELTISFTQATSGAYGLVRPVEEKEYNDGIWAAAKAPDEENWQPTSAGGGTYDLVTRSEIMINENEVKQE